MQKEQAHLRLKPGKERPLLQHHHWIYSGAVAELPQDAPFATVFSHSGKRLGIAMLNHGRSIVGHLLAFGEESLEQALADRLSRALALRKQLFDPSTTNAIRLVNAEGDGLPGLIIDSYNGVLVLQISHPSLDTLKPFLLEWLITHAQPRAIYEKSTSFLRKKEGLEEVRAHLYGESIEEVEIIENGLRYSVHLLEGQKTGLFLDQREMRALVRQISSGRKVLNCFAYTGGFSLAALAGGATSVDSVESSKKCEPWLEKNLALNGLSNHRFFCEDAIAFIAKEPLPYDLIILDPPAFVKKRQDIDTAFRAYKDLNCTAIAKMPPNSLLLTCSCSYHVSEELFQNILFRASLEAGRRVRILEKHRQAHDHPLSIFHPESSYLKSFLLAVD
ncbi:MAG: class I SAM-dependent rRNA methyltransferase [Verrucomicrobiota bacterium]|nr:class I SAM-dependent rRNA methyltransferase [Verrucomicrobiota bacterium]